jgi:hypothetical protein
LLLIIFNEGDEFMTFADLVEEVRQLPVEAAVELQHVIHKDLTDRFEREVLEGHMEAMEELKAGKLTFTFDPDELIHWLETE